MKTAYVNFVNHCYVDTEVEMKEIYTSNHIWKLFEDFTVDMARVTMATLTSPASSQHIERNKSVSVIVVGGLDVNIKHQYKKMFKHIPTLFIKHFTQMLYMRSKLEHKT